MRKSRDIKKENEGGKKMERSTKTESDKHLIVIVHAGEIHPAGVPANLNQASSQHYPEQKPPVAPGDDHHGRPSALVGSGNTRKEA